jgi:hypothetical protein
VSGGIPADPDGVVSSDDVIPADPDGVVPADPDGAANYRPIALVDLLDRVLAKGVVVSGELALSIADVDLVYVSLRALLASVRADTPPPSSREEDTW